MSRKVVPLLALVLVAGCSGSSKQPEPVDGQVGPGSIGGPLPTSSAPASTGSSAPAAGLTPGPTPGSPVAPTGAPAPGGAATAPLAGSRGSGGAAGTVPAGPPEPSAAPGVYSGTGNGVITVARSISGDTALARIVSRTAGPLHVEATNVGGTSVLVDRTGTYQGLRAFNSSGGDTTLAVRASGPWTITVTPASAARRFHGTVKGTGDDVLLYEGPGVQARITGGGPGQRFRVDANADELVNATSAVARTTAVSLSDGKALFEVQASGPWTITMS